MALRQAWLRLSRYVSDSPSGNKSKQENLRFKVMLTALLNSPDPDSHQYTDSSFSGLMKVHEEPVIFPQTVQLDDSDW